MRVSVIGLGYVGSVTAVCLAQAGHEVIGVDISPEKVAMINDAVSPVVEPGLQGLLAEMVTKKRIRATTSTVEAIRNTEIALICVGTPGRANGQPDLDAVERVATEIGRALRERPDPYTVVLRSTVPPGTAEGVLIPSLLAGARRDLGSWLRVAVNPEFMREGSSLKDFSHPPFTVVGCGEQETASLIHLLYQQVEAPFIHTTLRTAEMVKYVCNAFHALKISFANEIGDVCTASRVDAQEVMRIFMLDRKLNISEAYLRPGFAFGGSCLPKDLRALLHTARNADLTVPLLSAMVESNEIQIRNAIRSILETRKRRIGVVGLSFKAGTDDLRESPMVALVETLIGKGCDVRILDRNVSIARLVGANRRYIEEEIPHIASLMCEKVEILLAHADVLVLGSATAEAAMALAGAGPRHMIVDLTRGAVLRLPKIESLEVKAQCST